jgi:carbon monoxide dehydrogenase subunit G
MKLTNSFEVAAPPDRVWDFLLDLERVTPCMPGAELIDLPDERTWKGKVNVKLGAVGLSYGATVVIDEKDEAAHTVTLKANGRELRGKGMAAATINSRVEPAGDGGSQVLVVTDLTISGAMAQYGGGMIGVVAERLTGEFAGCLQAQLAAPANGSPAPAPEVPAAKPIGGLRLMLWAIGRSIASLFRSDRRDAAS